MYFSAGKLKLAKPYLIFTIMLLCLAITLVLYPLFSYLPYMFLLALLTGPCNHVLSAGIWLK